MAINKVVIGENVVMNISDASTDLSSSDIASGKSVYDGNGNKITGTGQTQIEGPIDGSLADGTATKYYVKRGTTKIGDFAFYVSSTYPSGFYHISEYDIPSSVTSIGQYAFYYNYNLKSISDLSNVESVGYRSFYTCNGLLNISLSNVKTIGDYAFYQCLNLSSIEIPNVQTIGLQAFYNCDSLTEIDISNATSIGGGAFYSCDNLTNIQVKNGVKITPQGSTCKIATINDHLYYQGGTASNKIYRDEIGTLVGTLTSSSGPIVDRDVTPNVTFTYVTLNDNENEENSNEFIITW